MIKCNRCGNITAAGAGFCQSCGAPFSNNVDNGMSSRPGPQDQPGLPAWLESLRVGEQRAVPPAPSPANFSAADFVEEGSLPNWMRSERNESRDNTASNLSLLGRSAPGAGAMSDEPANLNGIGAQSLVDEQSLPSWMREGASTSPQPPANGMAASSLIQQDNLPAWMKTLQSQQPAPAAPTANNTGGQAEQVKKNPPQVPAHGFSARELVDQQSLPSWMAPAGTESQGSAAASGANNTNASLGAMGQNGFSASSLLDVNALPQWLRDGSKTPQPHTAPSPAAWQPPVPQNNSFGAVQPPAQQQGENVSASSFIDLNALPSWLRTADKQGAPQGNPQQGGQQRPASSYTAPPRVENMRVPSRPRSEMNANEGSEVAANVFASMLGVASSTPNYPAQPNLQGPSNQYGQPNQMGNASGMPGAGSVPNTPSATPGQGYAGGSGMYGGYNNPAAGYAGTMGNGYTGNTGGYAFNQGNAYSGAANTNQGYAGMPNAAQTPSGSGSSTDLKQNAKPGKRGFLDTIRDWFERKS